MANGNCKCGFRKGHPGPCGKAKTARLLAKLDGKKQPDPIEAENPPKTVRKS